MVELLKRYWMVLVAGAIAAWAAYALINPAVHLERAYERQADADTAYYAEKAQSQYAWDCVGIAATAHYKCRYDKAQAAREGQHDANDLKAQLVSAIWTRQMGLAAIIGVAVSIVGVILVWITFRATREANAISRETMQRQLRAYLDFDGVSWVWPKDGSSFDPPPGLSVRIKNYGHTPATEILYTAIYRTKLGDGEPQGADGPTAERLHSISPIDHLDVSGQIEISEIDWAAFKDREATFIAELRVSYTDAFDKPHALEGDFWTDGEDFVLKSGTRKTD